MARDGRAVAAFLFLTLVWGTTWGAIRIALEGFPPLLGVAVRFTIAGVVLLAWALARGIRLGRSGREWGLWISNALLTFVGSYSIVYWAEQRVPSGLASILFATFPLWVVLLARALVPEERTSARRLVGVVAGFAGVAVLFSEDLDRTLGAGADLAALSLLGAALLSALGSVILKRYGRGIRIESLAGPPMLITGLILGPVAWWWNGERVAAHASAPWLATLYLALVGSAATFPVYFWLLSRRSVVSAALVSYTAPVVAVGVGVVALHEPLSARMVVGAALVLGGVAGALGRRARR